jgi:hypothetical protein
MIMAKTRYYTAFLTFSVFIAASIVIAVNPRVPMLIQVCIGIWIAFAGTLVKEEILNRKGLRSLLGPNWFRNLMATPYILGLLIVGLFLLMVEVFGNTSASLNIALLLMIILTKKTLLPVLKEIEIK